MQASVDKLASSGIKSLLFDPCGNVPDHGHFLSVMQQNVRNLEAAFHWVKACRRKGCGTGRKTRGSAVGRCS